LDVDFVDQGLPVVLGCEALLEDAKENQLLPDLVTGRSEFRNMGTRKRGK
jgi:hypothetical protein